MEENDSHIDPNAEPVVNEQPVKRKRGVRNVQNYKRNVIKKARLEGKAYENKKGKEVKSAEIGSDCKCRKRCFSRTNEMERLTMFSKFWDIKSKNAQDIYLQSLIVKEEVNRRCKKPMLDESEDPQPVQHQRTVTFRYFVDINSDTKLEVCKHSFCSMYGVTPDRVRRLCNLLKENKLPSDLRGKAPAKHAIPAETCKLIEEHIKSFPQKESHYSNKEVRNYLDAQLSVKRMFDLFKEKHPYAQVNYWFYHKIFKERFNLRFGRPQVDTCITCESLGIKIKSPLLNEAVNYY